MCEMNQKNLRYKEFLFSILIEVTSFWLKNFSAKPIDKITDKISWEQSKLNQMHFRLNQYISFFHHMHLDWNISLFYHMHLRLNEYISLFYHMHLILNTYISFFNHMHFRLNGYISFFFHMHLRLKYFFIPSYTFKIEIFLSSIIRIQEWNIPPSSPKDNVIWWVCLIASSNK